MAGNTVQIVIVAKDQASKPVQTIAASFGGLAKAALKVAGVVSVGATMAGVVKSAISVNAALEQNKVAFTNFLGSGEAATAMLNKLKKVAAETPFEFPQLVEATQRLLAYGFAAEQVIPLMTSIGNVASGMGQGAEGINRLTLALGQMAAKGVVRGQELLQLTEAGVKVADVFAVIAQKTGKSIAEVQEAQEKGTLSSEAFIAAFQEFADTKFGGMMEQQAKAFTGATSTIKDNIVNTLIAGGLEPLFKRISEMVVSFANFTKTESFERFAKTVAGVVGMVLDGFDKLGAKLKTAADIVGGYIIDNWEGFKVALAGVAAVAAAVVIPSLLSLATSVAATVAPIAVAIGAVALFAKAWTENWLGIRDVAAGVANWLGTTVFPALVQNFASLLTFVQSVAQLLYDVFTGNFKALGEDAGKILGAFLSYAATVLSNLWKVVGSVLTSVATFWGKVFDMLPQPVQDALTNILGNIARFLDWAWDKITMVWGVIVRVTGEAWRGILNVVGTILGSMAEKIAAFFDMLPGEWASGLASGLRGFAATMSQGLGNLAATAVQQTLQAMSSLGGSVADTIQGLMQGAVPSTANNIISLAGLFGDLQNVINGVVGGIQSLTQSVTNLTGSFTGGTPAAVNWANALNAGNGSGGGSGGSHATTSLEDPLAKAASLLEAITGALSGAIEMFGKLAGYKPDMTRFARGWQMLHDQIKTVITDIGQTLKSFGFEGESGAKSMTSLLMFAEVGKGIGDMISSMADSLSLLVKWKAPMKSSLDALLKMVEDVVWAVQESSRKMQLDALPGAQLMAETAGVIADMIAKVAGAFEYAAKFKPIAAGAFAPLADAIDRWVKGMVWLASKFDADGLKAARDMAETAGVIAGMLASVFEPMKQAATFRAVVMGGYAAIADSIERWVRGMVWLAGKFTEEGLVAARDLAATAGLIGQALEQVAAPMKKAAQFPVIPLGAFGNLADAMFRWVQGLAWLAGELEKKNLTMDAAAAMSQTVQIIGAALSGIIEPLKAAAEFPAMAAGVFGNMADGIRLMVTMLNDLKTELGAVVEGVLEFAGNLIQVINPMQDVVSLTNSMLDLSERIADGQANLAGVGAYLTTATRLAVSMLQAWSDEGSALYITWREDLAEWATGLVAVVSPLQTIISLTTSMIDLGAKIADGQANLANVGTYLNTSTRMAIAMLSSWQDEASALFINLPAKLEEYAARLSAVLSPFSAITSATGSMIDFAERTAEGTTNLGGAFALMNSVTRQLVAQMQEWERTLDLGGLAASGESIVAQYADKLGKIIAPFQTIAQTMTSVHDYARATLYQSRNLSRAITELGGYIEQIVTETAAMATRIGEATLKSAGNAATLLSPVSGFLDGLLSVFTRLSTWKRPAGFEGAVTALAADVNLLVSGIAGIALTDDNKATLAAMGDSLLPVVQAVSEMMNIFERVKYYAPLDATKLTRLLYDIETFVTQAMHTTNWHNLGEAATRSLIDGMVVGLTASDKRANLEAAMESLNALLGGDIGAGVEHVYNVTQNNTFNWNNPTFDVTTDERVRDIARQIVDEALQALGYQAAMNGRIFVPQV